MQAEPVWLDPARLTHKIAPSHDLFGRRGGDWDIDRRVPFAATIKARSIAQRYRDGADWPETDLFREIYALRFANGGSVRGEHTLAALAEQYRGRVDAMFADMKTNGFRTLSARGKPVALPSLLIGRDGALYIGNQGNHRLAMAQLLGLDRIAGRLSCWHKIAPGLTLGLTP